MQKGLINHSPLLRGENFVKSIALILLKKQLINHKYEMKQPELIELLGMSRQNFMNHKKHKAQLLNQIGIQFNKGHYVYMVSLNTEKFMEYLKENY